jgi:beta-glucosidase
VTAFDDAVQQVRDGTSLDEAAGWLLERCTAEERRWLLDGDTPFWPGLADMVSGGYYEHPYPFGAVARLGVPGFAFSDGPRGVVVGNATCFP